jgi:hypothetical protein
MSIHLPISPRSTIKGMSQSNPFTVSDVSVEIEQLPIVGGGFAYLITDVVLNVETVKNGRRLEFQAHATPEEFQQLHDLFHSIAIRAIDDFSS